MFITKNQIIPCVLSLRNEATNSVGSGIFVTYKNKCFIVTAKHVVNALDVNSVVILRGANDDPIRLKISDLKVTATTAWRFHARADVAILEIAPRSDTAAYFEGRFLPSEIIFPKLEAFDRDIQLTVFGFPLGLGAEGKFSPLSFRTYLASGLLTLPRFDNKVPTEFYILENPSTGGYSGGPVFDISIVTQNAATMYGDGTMLYGIVHGTISDATGGKLAAVTPAFFISETLAGY